MKAELGRGNTGCTSYHHLQGLLPIPVLASIMRLIMRLTLELETYGRTDLGRGWDTAGTTPEETTLTQS